MGDSSASTILTYVALLLGILILTLAEEKSIYIVLLEEEAIAFHRGIVPLEEGTRLDPSSEVYNSHAKQLVETHDQFLQSNLGTGRYAKLHSFTHLANGFAVHTTPSQAQKLKRCRGVKLVERDRGAKLMTTYTPHFLNLPEDAWSQEGGERNAGEGIVIGFVDSGINPLHPSFAYDPMNPFTSNLTRFSGACETGPRFPVSSCNGKIVSARFFAAGAQAAASLNASVDFLSPFDAVGHGSHVASTAAGNYGVPVEVNGFLYGPASGMAPRASRIAVYKAVYPSIATLADVLSAIDQAVKDGVDILTLSVGPDEPPEDTITFLNVFEIFLLLARRVGIFVVQAAGNKGPGPNTVVSFSPWAVGVAACSTDRSYPATLILGNGQKIGGVGLSGPTSGDALIQYKLVLAKDAAKVNGAFLETPYTEECQYPEAFEPLIVRGSVVICNFSAGFYNQTSTITAIIRTALTLGFMGFVLVANPTYGDFVAEPIPFPVPGIMVPRTADAQIISQYYERQTLRNKQGCVMRFGGTASIGEGRVASFKERAPIVSRFSSRGPDIIDSNKNPTDVLKPDIVAPGHQIWAAWSPPSVLDPVLEGNNFALLSGTSMATPHVAGIAALIKQLNPSWNPSMIASAMSTTAMKCDKYGETILAEGYEPATFTSSTPFDFGAGLVNPTRALDPGLVFSPGNFQAP
ncbi:hypothetical protein Ancab_033434 [Ancistrocladus abbreviatus]